MPLQRSHLKRILLVFLLLEWGAVFNSICAAAPLMVAKNLFASDRKPPSPECEAPPQNPAKSGMAIGNLQLDGVVIVSNTKRAILRMKNQQGGAPAKKGQPPSPFVTVREGETVSDYRVSKIDPKSISLEKDGQTFTVGLFTENKVVSPASVAPAPAPAQPPPAAPGVAQQEAGANPPPGVQPQPGYNPADPQQAAPVQVGSAPLPAGSVPGYPASQGNVQQNVYAPVINSDSDQAAETFEGDQ
jgi:hypothetical protein